MRSEEPLVIGLTDCGIKFSNYQKWVMAGNHLVEVLKLGYQHNNLSDVSRCDAFVLSGGEDVHPRRYGKPEYYNMLDATDVDERRDEFELSVIVGAEKNNKPLLGICRGLQIANVYHGGTLIPDIFTQLNVAGHNKDEDDDDSVHTIQVEPGTLLEHIVHDSAGQVNSSHHQSAEIVGERLKANAFSKDGIVEGLELDSKEEMPGVLLVQWHPERLKNQSSGFAGNIREWLINEALKWK